MIEFLAWVPYDGSRSREIRGNAAEISLLAGYQAWGSGVDVGAMDAITEQKLTVGAEMIQHLSWQTGSVIVVSGEIDLVSDGSQTMIIHNGCPTMARITGSGCMLTSLIGAFCGVMPEDCFADTAAAMAAMGVCGELAEIKRLHNGTGNAAFRTDLIDAVFNFTEKQLVEEMRYEIF